MLFDKKHERARNIYGFTIIELLIVIMIMVMFLGLGLANYRGFQRKQALKVAAGLIKSDLEQAKKNAISGVKPTGCSTLEDYNFDYISTTRYQITASCDNADYIVKDVNNFFPGISITIGSANVPPTPDPIRFNALANGTNISSTCTTPPCHEIILTQTTTGSIVNIDISSTGTIQ